MVKFITGIWVVAALIGLGLFGHVIGTDDPQRFALTVFVAMWLFERWEPQAERWWRQRRSQ